MNFPSSWISKRHGICRWLCVWCCVWGVVIVLVWAPIVRALCYFNEKPSGRPAELGRGWRRVEGGWVSLFQVQERRSRQANNGGSWTRRGWGLPGGRNTGEFLRKRASTEEQWEVSITWHEKAKNLWNICMYVVAYVLRWKYINILL